MDLLLTGSSNNSVALYSIQTEKIKNNFLGHNSRVSCVKFVNDKKRCVSGSLDRTIRFWDINKSSLIKTKMCDSSYLTLDLALTNSYLYSGHLDRSIKIWSLKSMEKVRELKDIHDSQIMNICLSSDESMLITNGRDNCIKIIDLRMCKVIKTLEHDGY